MKHLPEQQVLHCIQKSEQAVTQLLAALGRKISWRDIQHCPAARLPFRCQTMSRPRIGNEHTCRELRIGIQLQVELDDMIMLLLMTRLAGADYEAAMCKATMVLHQLFLADEMYSRVIFIKVIRHRLDFMFDLCRIGAVLEHHKALARMFLPRRQLRILTRTNSLQCALDWNRVLLRVFHARNAANRIGMPLTYALAPECLVFAGWQDSIAVDAGQ